MKFTPKVGLVLSVLLLIFSLTLSLSLAFCEPNGEQNDNDETETEWKNDGVLVTSAEYTYKTDISACEEALNTRDQRYLMLANKTYVIGESYKPPSITKLDPAYTLNGKEISLAGYAATAMVAMIDEMRAYGISNVYVTSGYRTFE